MCMGLFVDKALLFRNGIDESSRAENAADGFDHRVSACSHKGQLDHQAFAAQHFACALQVFEPAQMEAKLAVQSRQRA